MLFIQTNDARKTLKELGKTLSAKEIGKAQSRAINHTMRISRTEARKRVKEHYNIPQKELRELDIKQAIPSNLVGELKAPRQGIPLHNFSPKFETSTKSIRVSRKGEQKVREFRRVKKTPKGGVVIEVVKGQSKLIPYAFMVPGYSPVFARGSYKKGGGFKRREKRVKEYPENDLPISNMKTVSVYGSIINDTVSSKITPVVKTKYSDRLIHEIKFMTGSLDS